MPGMEKDMEIGNPPPYIEKGLEKSDKNTTKPEKRTSASDTFMLAMVLVAMSIIAWLIMVPFKNAIAEAEERAPVIRLYQSVHNRVTLNSSLNSTSAQLVDLQDQLATRMDLHHSVMSTNLDNFTTTLISITDEMDQSVEHLQLLRNLILVGARRSYLYWDQAASLLVDFKIQLRDPTISKELRLKVESIAEMAGIMEVEMKDMELFMKDMERKVAMALKKADSIVVAAEQMVQNSAEKPSGSLQQPLRASPYADNPLSTDKSSESPTPQSLQWSWDSYKDGQVVSTLGKYTPLQQRLIESFLTKQNSSLTYTDQPTILRYGIGLPDTYPTLEALLRISSNHSVMIETITSSESTLDDKGEEYTCDISAVFKREERELIGVRKVTCSGKGADMKDVVRERV